jgi:uncharacterized membrane protein YphA (DoxX/SURF4 family)
MSVVFSGENDPRRSFEMSVNTNFTSRNSFAIISVNIGGIHMQKAALAARIILGLIFLASGIAFFFTTPPPMEGGIAEFFKGLMATHYFIYLLKATEITCGLLLVSGFFVPLALVALAPVILNIFLVHAFLQPQGLPLAIVLGALEIFLAFFSPQYSPTIKQLFKKC